MEAKFPPIDVVLGIVRDTLAEDMVGGDVTSYNFIPPDTASEGRFVAKEPFILCGMPVAEMVFHELGHNCEILTAANDGDRIEFGATFATIKGNAWAILAGERTALNFLQHMSAIATKTARYVKRLQGSAALIYDTRKTTPGLRVLEKYAVRVGGGRNHRMGLYDQVLLKDNHIAVLRSLGKDVFAILENIDRDSLPTVEVEVTALNEAVAAVEAGADIIMLDNMTVEEMHEAVLAISHRAGELNEPVPHVEASGGVTLEQVAEIAATGVDRISVGALTHSVKAVDISLEII